MCPCSDGGPMRLSDEPGYVSDERRRLDRATRLLCYVMSNLDMDTIEYLIRLKKPGASELLLWWKRHQWEDRARAADEKRAREQAARRKKALAKLSPEDRKLLNL